MSTEDNSALSFIQAIMIFVPVFRPISYKVENAQPRKDLGDMRIKCKQLEAEYDK